MNVRSISTALRYPSLITARKSSSMNSDKTCPLSVIRLQHEKQNPTFSSPQPRNSLPIALTEASCSSSLAPSSSNLSKVSDTNKDYPSPNYSTRTKKIEYIIIHFTDMPFPESLDIFCHPKSKVSSHYLIREDGENFQLVDPSYIAWHAGVSSWHGIEKLNETSIGIEIANSGTEKFTQQQISTVVELCKELIAKYNISNYNILGHSDVAPNRKIDPGIFFDWKYLAEHNLGKWYDIEIPKTSEILFSFGNEGSKIKTLQENLGKLGYKIEITGKFDWQTNFVVRAFQSHYNPDIILKKGISYYRNLQSVYEWDECSQQILKSFKK